MRRLVTVSCLLALAGLALAEEPTVTSNVPSDRLEKILAGMKIPFKKAPGKKDGVWFYTFERQDRPVRLHNYDGQDLWIDSSYAPLPLTELNRWNAQTRHSRAVLVKTADKTAVSLEAQIDCLGGVTDAMVRQFITRFDGELEQFAKFTKK